MGRRSVPQPLALADDNSSSAGNDAGSSTGIATSSSPESTIPGTADRKSPRPLFVPENTLQALSPAVSDKSPKSPRSPFSKFNPTRRPQTQQGEPRAQSAEVHEQPPQLSADDTHLVRQQPHFSNQSSQLPSAATLKQSATLPLLAQSSGHTDEKHTRSGSRFFNFGKGSKTNNQLQHSHIANISSSSSNSNNSNNNNSEAMSRGVDLPGTMAERVPSKASKYSDRSSPDLSTQKAVILPSKSDISLPPAAEYDPTRKSKPKPFTLLGRNRSFKEQDNQSSQTTLSQMTEPEKSSTLDDQPPLKTAPLNSDAHDRSFRHMMNSSTRNHSADRAFRDAPVNKDHRNDKENRSHPSSIKDGGGSTFFGGLRSSGSRAADMISKGLFGKSGRSASTAGVEPLVDDEHYVLKVINLPLVEQTRKTRISKSLEQSRDKTEFWMPAFPWRAIDYLNFNGTEVEGLYRVPGSGPQIKKWQRRFDEENDVDLFAQDDLYDINIIGSMLKAWLRELPDELLPKEIQERISRHCAGAEKPPQMLIEELSNLSPFKYYLLFAVTCHLSLLLAHSDKNKMDFRNLCICFQPCMKIDAFCFKFLVCDWRLCWQGCKNEAKYIEEEYRLFRQPVPRGLAGDRRPSNGNDLHDERLTVSADDSKTLPPTTDTRNGNPGKKTLTPSQSSGDMTVDYSSSSAGLTVEHDAPTQRTRELRPLSPIKPLSPMNF
ncbi:hypothetical protein F4861DRAFT_488557 [Xylaria intraflava]|nr:hypothetical protein F4861DRAFT_488557 [Xylaria intraflava]